MDSRTRSHLKAANSKSNDNHPYLSGKVDEIGGAGVVGDAGVVGADVVGADGVEGALVDVVVKELVTYATDYY